MRDAAGRFVGRGARVVASDGAVWVVLRPGPGNVAHCLRLRDGRQARLDVGRALLAGSPQPLPVALRRRGRLRDLRRIAKIRRDRPTTG